MLAELVRLRVLGAPSGGTAVTPAGRPNDLSLPRGGSPNTRPGRVPPLHESAGRRDPDRLDHSWWTAPLLPPTGDMALGSTHSVCALLSERGLCVELWQMTGRSGGAVCRRRNDLTIGRCPTYLAMSRLMTKSSNLDLQIPSS